LLEVREGEVPIKEVTGRFDKTKITALFTEWQCQPIKVSLAENDGQLPKNPYGNFECFVCPPP
jgi:xeroderma pigmentosum group C-complementing protein